MSGSPKYSTVNVSPAYAAQEAARRRQREAERKRREQQRAQRRAQEKRRRAEATAKRAAQREAEDRKWAAETGRERRRATAGRLREVQEMLTRARQTAGEASVLGVLDRVEARLGELRQRMERHPDGDLDSAIEELRGQVVVAERPDGDGARDREHRARVLAELTARLDGPGPDAAAYDEEGRKRCAELLRELRAAADAGEGVRFEALRGTVEHALTRHAATVRRRAAQELERKAAERAAERAAQARAEEDERRREDALAEADDRLSVVRGAVHAAIGDAADFKEPGLARRLTEAEGRAGEAMSARDADAALAAVAELEALLPEAEAVLDELLLAHERRTELATALQDAMSGEGLAFTGGEDLGPTLVLHFQRPNGAEFETAVGSDDDGAPLLVYRIEGEPDVSTVVRTDGAVCDATEQLLERVHEAMGRDGFLPGELTWQGKPPREQGRTLPPREWRTR